MNAIANVHTITFNKRGIVIYWMGSEAVVIHIISYIKKWLPIVGHYTSVDTNSKVNVTQVMQ